MSIYSTHKKQTLSPLLLAACAGVIFSALPAHLSLARAGRGGSIGSRGTHTYTPPPPTRTAPGMATPFTHTLTPPMQPARPAAPYTAPPQQPAPKPSLFRSHPFATGFLGGLLGAGLFGLLSGHGLFGPDGFSGFLGILLQLVILFFIIRWLYNRFATRKNQPTAPSSSLQAKVGGTDAMIPPSGSPSSPSSSLTLTHDDYMSFQKLLVNIQGAWSQRNMVALQRFATPEMVSYFNEQLAELSSRGLHNVVSDIRFEKGDLSEAWQENGMQYATVAMQYSMIDVTTDSTGRVVEGNAEQRVSTTEIWTFVRSSQNGYWLLSAIQQTR